MVTGTSTAGTTTATICSWFCGTSTCPSTPTSICIPPWSGGGPSSEVRQKRRHGEDLRTRERDTTPHELAPPTRHLDGCPLPDLLQPSEVTVEVRSQLAAKPHTNWWWERLPAPERAAHLGAPQQRHESKENWHHRHDVSHLLHGVPLHPLLRYRLSRQPVWPGAGDRWLVVVEKEVLHTCLGVEGSVALARSSPRAPLARPWPSCPRGAVRCVNAARAIATLRRSWRKNCLSRRSRRLRAVLQRELPSPQLPT